MALPPTAANPADTGPDPGMQPPGDAPMEGGESTDPWQPIATVLKNSETGEFMLVDGDEPDDGTEPEGEVFPDGPGLLRALMGRLEGNSGVDEAFGEGFKANAKKPMAA